MRILNFKEKILVIFVIVISILVISSLMITNDFEVENIFNKKKNNNFVDVSNPNSIFQIVVEKDNFVYNTNTGLSFTDSIIKLNSEFEDEYNKVRYSEEQNTVIVYPIFTEAAYNESGFYDYFEKICDEICLTVPIEYNFDGGYGSSNTGYQVLSLLGYPIITDIDVDKNPEILNDYEKIILLHNEYVTKKEFDAIMIHPNVIYLYPNALYAEISVDYQTNTITLLKGHGYPESSIKNGFGWEFDNTHPYEYDKKCEDWEFYKINNGFMLNCYPENFITESWDLLEAIREI